MGKKKRASVRAKPSRITELPDSLQKKLNQLLRAGISQKSILDQMNGLLERQGEKPLSKSSLQRHVVKIEKIGKRIRDARQVADAWTAKFGEAPTGELGQHIINMLRTLTFELTLDIDGKVDEEGQPVINPETINSLALAVQRMEKASQVATAREKELRLAVADDADKVMQQKGLSSDVATAIRDVIEGIVK